MDTEIQPKEIKINKEDSNALKRTLDDAVIRYFTIEKGFKEDFSLSNTKITLGIISVILGLTAQFYPYPFPENWYVLIVCCSTYFVCSSILQYFATFEDKEYVAIVTDENNEVIRITSSLPRYDYNYVLSISSGSKRDKVSIPKMVNNFFDINGVLYEQIFAQHVKELHGNYIRNKTKKTK